MIKLLAIIICTFTLQSNLYAVEIYDYVDDWLSAKEAAEIQNIYPAFYKYKAQKWSKQGLEPNKEVNKQFNSFETIKDTFVKKYHALKPIISTALEDFKKHFPDMKGNNKIVLLHSLGELNGGIRVIDNEPIFLLGLDIMAKYHNWENDIPFFHHEFFHLYHKQKAGKQFGRGYIGDELWKEGVATYISEVMNKKATPSEMMLNIPPKLYEDCQKKIAGMSKELLPNLRTQNDELYKKYFLLSSTDKFVPKRAGYCVGYLAVKKFGPKYSLRELSDLNFDIAIKKIELTLKGFVK
ncbi:MAG: hypothetical protein R3B45_16365 [Bdellovibrionota bacterium]